jgi:expansin
MGKGPFTLRVTDRYGNVLEDRGIPLIEDRETAGQAQFPAGP